MKRAKMVRKRAIMLTERRRREIQRTQTQSDLQKVTMRIHRW
jgi:hypothetical protein